MLSLPKTYILLLSFISISFFAKSQSLLYPVKIDHKWGYMDIRGNIVIEPRYDIISNQDLLYYSHRNHISKSKFRLVETNEKLGLINNRKEEILPTKYNRIRVLTDTIFSVFNTKDDDKFTTINLSGQPFFSEKYQHISFLDHNKVNTKNYFLVKNEGELWGVQKSGGGLVLPMKYREVKVCQVDGDFFKVKKNKEYNLWGIYKAGNKKVLEMKYEDVIACHDNFYAAHIKDRKWAAYDSLGVQILKPEYNYFTPLNRHLMSMQWHDSKTQRNHTYLYSFVTNDTITHPGNLTYYPLDEKFITYGANYDRGIIDTLGQVVVPPSFYFIKKYNEELYLVNQDDNWGLWHQDNRMVLPCRFDSIGQFTDRFAEVYSSLGVGLINKKFQEIIPANYTRLKIEGNSVKAFQGEDVEIYKFNDAGEFIGMENFEDVFSFKLKSKGGEILDARAIKRKMRIINRTLIANSIRENHTQAYRDSKWKWYVDIKDKRKPIYLTDSTRIEKKGHPNFKKISSLNLKTLLPIGEGSMTVLYSKRDKYKSYFSRMTGLSLLCKASIFHHEKEDLLSAFSLLGIRSYDFFVGHKYAAVLDENEVFGLMDRQGDFLKGKDGKKMEFTYIGHFFNGKARVCQGGKLIEMESSDFLKYSIGEIAEFCRQFNLVGYYPNQPKKGRIRIKSTEENPAKWGFIDSVGNFIITPQYKYLEDDVDGQAVAVNQKGKWGVIDSKTNRTVVDFKYAKISPYFGDWRINARAGGEIYFNKRGWQIAGSEYDSKGEFKNGFCAVQKEGKWGFIAESGDLAIECKYDVVKNFNNNIAATKTGNQWIFIDKEGNDFLKINQPDIEDIGNLKNGRCWFKAGGLYGFLDSTGTVIVTPQYKKVFNYEGNVARVIQNKKTGIIDLEGNEIIKPNTFTFIYPFNQYGLAIIQKEQSGNQGLINKEGKMILPPTYHVINKFRDGLAAVSNGRDYGYIDTMGKLVLPLKYKDAKPFSEGLAAVKQTTQDIWVYINKNGKKTVKGSYLATSPFIQGRAQVKKYTYGKIDGIGMIIDRKGTPIVTDLNKLVFFEDNIAGVFNTENKIGNLNKRYYYGDIRLNNLFDAYFQEVNPFQNGFSVFRKSRRLGVINKRGMHVVKNKYYSLEVMGENIITVKPPAFGIADRTGKVTIPIKFDEITLMSGEIYKIEQGEKVGYTDKTGKWIWDLQY